MTVLFGGGQFSNVAGMRGLLGTYAKVTIAWWMQEPGTLGSVVGLDDDNRSTSPFGGVPGRTLEHKRQFVCVDHEQQLPRWQLPGVRRTAGEHVAATGSCATPAPAPAPARAAPPRSKSTTSSSTRVPTSQRHQQRSGIHGGRVLIVV